MKNTHWLVLLVFLLIAFYALFTKRNSEAAFYKNNISAMADSITYFKNENGYQVAVISSLESDRVKDILQLVSDNKEIQRLQEVIKDNEKKLKNRGSVTNFSSDTSIDTVFITTVTVDTTNYPTYSSDIDMKGWITGGVKANKDSISLNLKVKNEYSIVIGEEPNGWFKKSTPFGSVTNYNPYSRVTSLRTYQVSLPRKKKFHVGPSITMSLNGTFVVGGSLTYSLISF